MRLLNLGRCRCFSGCPRPNSASHSKAGFHSINEVNFMQKAEKLNIRWQLLRSATSAAGSEILQRRVTRPYRQKTRSIDGYCGQKSSTSVETTYCDATGAAGSPQLCVERQCDGLSCTFDLMTASDVTPSAPCLNCLWHNKGK